MRGRDLLWMLPLLMLVGMLAGGATYGVLNWVGLI